ncbi:sugar ABC transporter ATP-binding protein [Pseudoroseicyclus aestuarii]|uniref:Monosaccharide ABC transporter ATP-binding protein (CUT2 family) n=1 Tax=Pseudoroseicyclus aestuarii TaxID=1795041 RepID=A0A318T5G9_9RHOB|nr:sugar ABC transporter ATP-binding protein [Pseudoroseicyclus aestuarii]PYE85634.1 monosaccharide ABC transporter ATP-binding protein (CUT2 family) [Pseudoroseicyclus aestuarii]
MNDDSGQRAASPRGGGQGVTGRLALSGVDRSFGPVEVLHDVSLVLQAGEVHALIGENGAGKSTTMKILSGYLRPSSGRVLLEGQEARFEGSDAAEAQGVVLIHQEFNLAEDLTVEENVFLGRELRRGPLLDKRAMRTRTRALLERLECRVDPGARVRDLAGPDKQMVEIAKALGREARVLIMDEPTAVLTGREAEVLFAQVDRLRAEGVAILFTSHKLDEVKRISDRVTVMRDGRVVASRPTEEMSEDAMAEAMVGRALSDLFPARSAPVGEGVALRLRDLTVPGHARGLSFDLHEGEVLGLAGLIGSGRTEAMEGLVGLRPHEGTIEIGGHAVRIASPRAAQAHGLVYLTEDRKGRGLVLNMGLRENLTLQALEDFAHPFLDRRAEAEALTRAIRDFDIRAPSRDAKAGTLSGGNQQKLLLAKVLLAKPRIVIIDEPTRGIDIGTKQQIYRLIHDLAAEGVAVIVISSELPEVIGLADRVLVMRQGRIAGEVAGEAKTEDTIVRLAMGLDGKETAA